MLIDAIGTDRITRYSQLVHDLLSRRKLEIFLDDF